MSTLSLDPSVSFFEPAVPQSTVRAHGRRADRPATLRARRASASSTTSPAVLARAARLVAVRVIGTSAAAAAVTWALAVKDVGASPAVLGTLSIRGLAAAAIICAAWGFQDRARLGTLTTARAWWGTALALGVAHATWFASTLPGTAPSRAGITVAALALDVALVVAPALLGARAGRPEVHRVV